MAAASTFQLRQRFLQLSQCVDVSSYRTARSGFLKECGEYYKQLHPGSKCFLTDDGFVAKAEQLIQQKIFADHPGSFNRLKPLAECYLVNWLGLNLCFTRFPDGESTLIRQVDGFVHSHHAFVRQFIAEYKSIGKATATGAQVINPKTLQVFYCTVFEFLINHSSEIAVFEEMFARVDPKLIDLIPYCSILSLLYQGVQSDKLPEFFAPLASDWISLSEMFSHLSVSEKTRLSQVLFLSSDETVADELTESGKEVFQKIFKFIYDSKANNSTDFNALEKAVFKFVHEDLQLARSIQGIHALAELELPASASSIVSLLYGLPDSVYAEFEKAFLPPRSELMQSPPSVIEGRRLFYRLSAIVALSKALPNSI